MIQTSQSPDRGYMGDRARGASFGRGDRDPHALIRYLQKEIADDTRRADDHENDPKLDWHIWPENSDKRGDYIAKCRADAAVNQARIDALRHWLDDGYEPKVHLRGIRLDSGGYDPGGAYWGTGGWLWEAYTADGAYYQTGRVYPGSDERKAALEAMQNAGKSLFRIDPAMLDRETAKAEIRESLPGARFYR